MSNQFRETSVLYAHTLSSCLGLDFAM